MATTKAPTSALDTLIQQWMGGGSNRGQVSTSDNRPQFNGNAEEFLDYLMKNVGRFSPERAVEDVQGVVLQNARDMRAKELPSINSVGRTSGMYNSTAQDLARNDLESRIVGRGQEIQLQNIKDYAQIEQLQGQTIANINNSSRVQTSNSQPAGGGGSDWVTPVLGLLAKEGLGALKRTGREILGDTTSPLIDTIVSPVGGGGGNIDMWDLPAIDDVPVDTGGVGIDTGGGTGGGTGIDWIDDVVDWGGGIVDDITDTVGGWWEDLGGWLGLWANGGRIPGPSGAGGKDNKIIGVGGGEVVLPVDTVEMMDARYGEDWVDKLIQATHKNVTPKPTGEVKQAARNAGK